MNYLFVILLLFVLYFCFEWEWDEFNHSYRYYIKKIKKESSRDKEQIYKKQ